MLKNIFIFALSLALPIGLWAQTPEQQAARQARSVHLAYSGWGNEAQIFYCEVRPEMVYPGTYFCTVAFSGGYSGIQELANREHVAIFSVWEPSNPFDFGANPNRVDTKIRTGALYAGKDVVIRRFGGEGTGGQSMMKLNWKKDRPLPMAISCEKDGPFRTAYTCWIWKGKQEGWFQMATFTSLIGKGKATMTDPYSFVEDFLRNVTSKHKLHQASYLNFHAYRDGAWYPATQANFTADNNLLKTIDAIPVENGFCLKTGADTENKTTKLWSALKPLPGKDTSVARREALVKAVKALQLSPKKSAQQLKR